MQTLRSFQNLSELEDDVLIARVRQRDRRAFGLVYERHAPAAYGLALRMCGESQLAEDVVQETFMSLWRGVGRYDASRGSLRGWLLAATRHRMIDAFRVRASKQSADVPDEGQAEEMRSSADTHREVAERQRAQTVRHALGELPDEQRRVIELAFFGGLSHSQIAGMLKLPAGTVKGRMRLGMDKLRRTLGTPSEALL